MALDCYKCENDDCAMKSENMQAHSPVIIARELTRNGLAMSA